MKLKLTTILLSALTINLAYAKEYTLAKKGYQLPAGTILETTEKSSAKELKVTLINEEEELHGTVQNTTNKVTQTNLITNTKAIVKTTTSEEVNKMVMEGEEIPDHPETDPLLNKTVEFEKIDGLWNVTNLEKLGDAIENAKRIATSMNSESNNSIYGYKPRKIGDTWKADSDAIKSHLNQDGAIKTASATLTLLSVKTENGREIATIKIDIKASWNPQLGMTTSMNGPFTIKRDLGLFIDIDSAGSVKQTMIMKQGTMTINMIGNATMSTKNSIKSSVIK